MNNNDNMERVLVDIELVSWEYIRMRIRNDNHFTGALSDNDWENIINYNLDTSFFTVPEEYMDDDNDHIVFNCVVAKDNKMNFASISNGIGSAFNILDCLYDEPTLIKIDKTGFRDLPELISGVDFMDMINMNKSMHNGKNNLLFEEE
nr:hypothetical protein [Catenibacterium mitsuokai]